MFWRRSKSNQKIENETSPKGDNNSDVETSAVTADASASTNKQKETILITGASGCVAQHVIRELQSNQEWSEQIDEIRLVDRKPLEKFLEYEERVPMKFIKMDILDEHFVDVMTGCTVVFHLAARLYNFNIFPKTELYLRDNVAATEAVLSAMQVCNVQRLVFMSDAMANVPSGEQFGSSEPIMMEPPPRNNYALGVAAETKYKSETIASEYCRDNQTALGLRMSCLILRPTVIYGEGDSVLVPHALDLCKKYGRFVRIGETMSSVWQVTYAGNAAVATLNAWQKQKADLSLCNGEVVFINDGEQAVNYFDFIEPYIEAAGYKLAPFSINTYLSFVLFLFIELFVRFLHIFIPDSEFVQSTPSLKMVRLCGAWCYGFSTQKARLFINYIPKYSQEQANEKSLKWWKQRLESKPLPKFEYG